MWGQAHHVTGFRNPGLSFWPRLANGMDKPWPEAQISAGTSSNLECEMPQASQQTNKWLSISLLRGLWYSAHDVTQGARRYFCFWRRLVHAFEKPGPEAQTWIPKSGHVVCLPPHPPPFLRLSAVGPYVQGPLGVRKWAAAVAPRLERPWQPNSDRYGRALRRLNEAVSVQIRPRTPTILDCLRMTPLGTRLAWRRLGTRAQ